MESRFVMILCWKQWDEIEHDENVTHWDDYNCEIPSDDKKTIINRLKNVLLWRLQPFGSKQFRPCFNLSKGKGFSEATAGVNFSFSNGFDFLKLSPNFTLTFYQVNIYLFRSVVDFVIKYGLPTRIQFWSFY